VEVPVLIVGGGPAGLCTSILLSRHGVHSLLVERHPTTSVHPRARGIGARVMELFRAWGIEADVQRLRIDMEPCYSWGRTLSSRMIRVPSRLMVDTSSCSPCQSCACPQDRLEPLLLEVARSRGEADLRFGHELVAIEEVEGWLAGIVRDRSSGTEVTVRCRYLVAADGADSWIRDRVGIETAGDAHLAPAVSIMFNADLERWAGSPPCAVYRLEALEAATLFPYGDGRWILSLQADPAADYGTDRAARLLETVVGAGVPDLRIEGVTRWTMGARSALTFRRGRVLLAGDAAHQLTPFGALGMNTAISDTENLAWKLAAVLSDAADPALLETYDVERRPVGEANVEQSLRNWRSGPGGGGPSPLRLEFGYGYDSAAVVPDGTTTETETEEYVPSARPGRMAPLLWLRRRGNRIPVGDLFGDGWTVIAGPEGGAWRSAAAAIAAESRLAITAHVVGAGEDLEAEDETWLARYGLTRGGAVLVRPDGHIGYRSATSGAGVEDRLRHVLRRLLGPNAA
jgi:putative polyketide hydroxylase